MLLPNPSALLLAFSLLFCGSVVAQKNPPVVDAAEVPAHLPNCAGAEDIAACNNTVTTQWVVDNIRISKRKIIKAGGGMVVIEYVVGYEGEIESAQVVVSAHPDLDAACLDVVKRLPKHVPATIDGTPVRMRYRIPVRFKQKN